ncbi:MAG: FIST C-terminal domain-containing protein [Deltaproteobacteria bacterium]|nr:FIST C-terminal domain-containing protein [Deltaproteobacteria bacterium]
MTKLTVGKSSASDTASAVQEALAEALSGAQQPVFALVLSTDQYDHERLASAANSQLDGVPWAGCCTAGVLAGDTLLNQGVVVGVISSTDLKISVGIGGSVSVHARAAGRSAVAQALAGLPAPSASRARALIVLPDAVTANAAEVVRGCFDEAGSGIAWAGGGAGDNLRFIRSAQYAHGRAFHDQVVVVAIEASRVGAGIRHGWKAYGPPTMVTRARGSSAVELEYEKAFDVYRRTVEHRGGQVSLETFPAFAMTHPLGIPQADGEHVIRDPLAVEADGSLRCVCEVPDGSLVRIMQGDREALLAAAYAAASDAREAVRGELGGALVFDCVSRSLMLGDGVRDELAAFQEGLGGSRVPIMGCLTFGEIGALGTGVPQFHNKTAVLLALPA